MEIALNRNLREAFYNNNIIILSSKQKRIADPLNLKISLNFLII